MRLVVCVCVGGFKTAEVAIPHPGVFLPPPRSASGYSCVLCVSSLLAPPQCAEETLKYS